MFFYNYFYIRIWKDLNIKKCLKCMLKCEWCSKNIKVATIFPNWSWFSLPIINQRSMLVRKWLSSLLGPYLLSITIYGPVHFEFIRQIFTLIPYPSPPILLSSHMSTLITWFASLPSLDLIVSYFSRISSSLNSLASFFCCFYFANLCLWGLSLFFSISRLSCIATEHHVNTVSDWPPLKNHGVEL